MCMSVLCTFYLEPGWELREASFSTTGGSWNLGRTHEFFKSKRGTEEFLVLKRSNRRILQILLTKKILKYLVTVKLVTDYLLHLQDLKFRREKRTQDRKKVDRQS